VNPKRHRRDESDDRIFQKKSLGQVFLNTDQPIHKIIDILTSHKIDTVVEIGPGAGILTRALGAAKIHTLAIEKDDRFAERVMDAVEPEHRSYIQVLNEDVLKFDLGAWLVKQTSKNIAVIGNIPYNISSPIVLWVLPHITKLKLAMFMVQLEFAKRVVAKHNIKDYSSLSVYCQLRADCRFEFEVPRGCFTPVPKVDSAVMTLTPKAEPTADDATLLQTEKICRGAFLLRRKKLRNGVKPFLSGKNEADCPVSLDQRAENLTPLDFVALTRFLRR
jgi:16S rRNA (adenine1518-N6/adenine1519-N6)-dimethyltransferase